MDPGPEQVVGRGCEAAQAEDACGLVEEAVVSLGAGCAGEVSREGDGFGYVTTSRPVSAQDRPLAGGGLVFARRVRRWCQRRVRCCSWSYQRVVIAAAHW
ncbi:hypothetical protein ACZ90_63630 [Streptomyces albus subsp. albus]|nr:hypothetical protein ACZ90_63630 [Streptomyces albus subsp. albus]